MNNGSGIAVLLNLITFWLFFQFSSEELNLLLDVGFVLAIIVFPINLYFFIKGVD